MMHSAFDYELLISNVVTNDIVIRIEHRILFVHALKVQQQQESLNTQ